MKKILFLVMSIVLGNFCSYATTTYTVGTTGTYPTILSAYNDCIDPDKYIIEILDSYDYSNAGENGGITLLALPSKDATNTVTIRLASGVSKLFSTSATSMFTLQGADWVIFDGRAGGIGTTAWTMINTSSSASRRVFTLTNDATNNVFQYCTVKGRNSSINSSNAGLFYFTGTGTAGVGNSNNTITDCIFENHTTNPKCFIYSKGINANTQNANNTISNCHFINTDAYSIWLENNPFQWNITNNHFYQTSNQSISTNVRQIYIVSTVGGHTISGNFIGGQGPSCSGSPYTLDNLIFYGILASCGAGTNTIENNTIANLNLTSSNAATSLPTFCGIYTGNSGNFIIGSSGNGNTIGATTGTGNIVINYSGTATSQPVFSGIYLAAATNSVTNNTFGAIDYSSSVSNGTDDFSLIRLGSSNTTSIDSNTFGNTTANNITITSNSAFLAGIYSELAITPTLTISNNKFQNFTINDAVGGTDAKIRAIYIEDLLLPTSIYNNTIKTLTNNTLFPGVSSEPWNASVSGIVVSHTNTPTGDISVYGNIISDLVSSYNGGTQSCTSGIGITSANIGTVSVFRNKIKNLTNASTNASSTIIGLSIANTSSDSAMVYNNVISIGDGSNTDAKIIRGIVDEFSTGISNIFHNTVKIYSNYSSGTAITSALYLATNTASYRVKNNIFQNVSNGNGTHYAQNWTSTYATTSNIRNNYDEATDVSKLVSWGGIDKTITSWRTAISDGSTTEVTGSITIGSTTGAPSSSDIVGSTGTPISSVATDYDLNPRSSLAPWIGAFELITALPIELLDISAKCQKSKLSNSEYGATIKWTTAMEINSDYFIVEGSKDGFVWEVKDTLDGAGTLFQPTNYYYHDDFINPTPENETVVYYRVSQTNFDGEIKTFDIQSCKCEASDKIKIHPIPSNESIVINFGDQNNVPNSFQITDMFGHIIEDITVVGDKANNTSYTLDIRKYPSGRYIIKINDWKMKEDGIFIKE